MRAEDYWNLFIQTGSPEVYLMYNDARKLEMKHVCYNSGPCAESNTVQ